MSGNNNKSKKQAKQASSAAAAAPPMTPEERALHERLDALRLRQLAILHGLQTLRQEASGLVNPAVSSSSAASAGAPGVAQEAKEAEAGAAKPKKEKKEKKPKEPKQPKAAKQQEAPVEIRVPDFEHPLTKEQRLQAVADDASAGQFLQLAFDSGFDSSEVKRCPDDYYAWKLEQRKDYLGAADTRHLCKTLVVRNTRLPEDAPDIDPNDVTRCRYYMVVVQYVTALNSDMMSAAFRKEHQARGGKCGKNAFNIRLCPGDISFELTGFEHNAVSPVGSKTRLPMLMHQGIAELPYVWLGGGEVSLKWKVSVQDLVKVYQPIIGNIALPKAEGAPVDD